MRRSRGPEKPKYWMPNLLPNLLNWNRSSNWLTRQPKNLNNPGSRRPLIGGLMDQSFSVMILDDEPIVCDRLRSTLEKINLDIETFTDPNEAIKRFAETKFQILITDLKIN